MWESSAPSWEDLQMQMQTSEADLEHSQHPGHLPLALPNFAVTLHYRGFTSQGKSGRQVYLTCDRNLKDVTDGLGINWQCWQGLGLYLDIRTKQAVFIQLICTQYAQ